MTIARAMIPLSDRPRRRGRRGTAAYRQPAVDGACHRGCHPDGRAAAVASTGEAYEARYDRTAGNVFRCVAASVLAAAALAFAPAILLLDDEGEFDHPGEVTFILVLAALAAGFFATAAVGWTIAVAGRGVALRADADGVTFGRHPMPPKRAIHLPWSDVDAVVVFRFAASHKTPTREWIGVRLRPGAPVPRAAMWSPPLFVRPVATAYARAPDRTYGDVSRPVAGWTLRLRRLRSAVRRYGTSHVSFEDRR
jgi:hypothetical protein